MKHLFLVLFAVFLTVLSSCKPYRVDPLEKVQPNETAFLIPLEDGTENQQKLESVEFLKNQQVAAKQIVVPQRYRQLGRMYWSGEWIPTMRVMRVDRTPVTRSWTSSPMETTRTETLNNSNRVFGVESKDSIGFAVGVNISAHIEESDAPIFLYYYRENNLAEIMDQNVREKVHTALSREFARLTLEESKVEKVQITDNVANEVTEHFKKYGITITSIGLAEGLEFEQPEIQQAINQAYVAEMQVKRRAQEVEEQREVNKRLLEEANGKAAAELKRAEGEKAAAEVFASSAEIREKVVALEVKKLDAETRNKWDGKLPTTSLGRESGTFLNLK